MTDTPFEGVYPALTTPFDENGRIDFEQLRADVRRLERAGVDGVVPVGSTGESATLTHDEHVQVIEATVETATVPVVAGTGSNNTQEALSLSRRAADVGADALLLISPYYNRPEQRGLRAHYETIADGVDLPQIVYNVPSRTGQNIEADTVVTLASHPTIQGLKAASGDLSQISEVVERTREEEFAVLSGDDALTLPAMSVGATGTISVVANVEPERTVAMVEAAQAGDYEEAGERHHELAPLWRALFCETNPIPVKEALHIREGNPPHLRSPLTRLTPDLREELSALLDDLSTRSVPAEAAD